MPCSELRSATVGVGNVAGHHKFSNACPIASFALLLGFGNLIEVERPVSRAPPRRSQRAVFSHWALHNHSPCTDIPSEFLLSGYDFHDTGRGFPKMFAHFIEPRPGVTAFLKPPIEPFKQHFRVGLVDHRQTLQIPDDTVIVPVSPELLSHFCINRTNGRSFTRSASIVTIQSWSRFVKKPLMSASTTHPTRP